MEDSGHRYWHYGVQSGKEPAPTGGIWADAVNKSPNKVRPWLNLGVEYGKRGDYENAKICFERITDLNPLIPNAYQNLGITKLALGDIEGGTEALLCAYFIGYFWSDNYYYDEEEIKVNIIRLTEYLYQMKNYDYELFEKMIMGVHDSLEVGQ